MMRIIGILSFSLLACIANAQTVTWKLLPSDDYTSISLFGNGMYKVTKGSNIGIIQADGTSIVPVSATGITGFYEEKALVLSIESNRNRILGYLTEQGQYVTFDKTYYGLDGMYFFSEGYLPVQDEKGRLGYLDKMGKAVLGFRGEYSEIHPFTEGMAAVFDKDEEFALIDRQGREAVILTGGEIGEGTNLYNGQAFISDAYNDNVFYSWEKNQSSSMCKKVKAPKQTDVDYLYCFSQITGRPANVPYQKISVANPDFEPVSEGGLWGFRHNGIDILPCQLESASSVVNGLSIVKLNGKFGILQISGQDNGFSAKAPSEPFKYINGKSIDCHFFMEFPTVWQGQQLQVSATDLSTGEQLNVSDNGQNRYLFSTIPSAPEQEYKVSVLAGELELWHGSMTMHFKKRQIDLQTSLEIAGLKSNTARADADDRVIVRAIVTNPGNEPVTAVISMKGSEAFKSKTETHQIPAHGKVVVESFFVVKENLENQYVKVTTDNGATSTQYSLRLKTVDDIND